MVRLRSLASSGAHVSTIVDLGILPGRGARIDTSQLLSVTTMLTKEEGILNVARDVKSLDMLKTPRESRDESVWILPHEVKQHRVPEFPNQRWLTGPVEDHQIDHLQLVILGELGALPGGVSRRVADGAATDEATFTDSMTHGYHVASVLTITTDRRVSGCITASVGVPQFEVDLGINLLEGEAVPGRDDPLSLCHVRLHLGLRVWWCCREPCVPRENDGFA